MSSSCPLRGEIRKIYNKTHPPTIELTQYFRRLLTLQAELIKLQDWVQHTKAKIIVIFEGRDVGVAAVYQRHDFLAERKEALDRWGAASNRPAN